MCLKQHDVWVVTRLTGQVFIKSNELEQTDLEQFPLVGKDD